MKLQIVTIILFLSWVTLWYHFCCHKWRLKPLQLDGSISVQLKSDFSFQKSHNVGVRWERAYMVVSVAQFQPAQVQRWKVTQWLSLGVNLMRRCVVQSFVWKQGRKRNLISSSIGNWGEANSIWEIESKEGTGKKFVRDIRGGRRSGIVYLNPP